MIEVTTVKYRAFISYSHRDTPWCKWLHGRLEGFKIDKELAGQDTAMGPIPNSLRPIFRDRDEFTAGHTLSEQTQAALDASAAVVVLCSPASAKSHYVNEEVRLFKQRHPDRPIVPLILDGKPGDAEQECFPPALQFAIGPQGQITGTPEQLLAADVREAGDGRELALAKVIARLLGLGTDDVFRRAERERRRAGRVRNGIGLAMLLLALAVGIFAWINKQQQQTITDVEAIVAKYRVADQANAAPGAKQSLADAITAIAQGAAADPRYATALDLLKQGKPTEAEPLLKAVAEEKKQRMAKEGKEAAEAFRNLASIAAVSDPGKARNYYAEAAKLDPDNIEGMFQNGWFQLQAGQLDAAETAYRRVIAVGRPGKDDENIYWARVGIGHIRVARGDLSGAKSDYQSAGEAADRLARADPLITCNGSAISPSCMKTSATCSWRKAISLPPSTATRQPSPSQTASPRPTPATPNGRAISPTCKSGSATC
jgi:tetratricopeptide (TPR) repeat protein